MNNLRKLFAVIILTMVSFSCAEEKKPAEADIHFFYLELCPGCDDYVLAERISAEVLSIGGTALNIIHDEDANRMREILTEKKLQEISHVLPLLVIEDSYIVGYEEIVKKLEELTE